MDGGCRIIMQGGVLIPGMTMPALGPPPPDPHPNPTVQRMRATWNLNFIAWHGVWDQRSRWPVRRPAGDWCEPRAPRCGPVLFDQSEDGPELENC